MLIQDIKPVQKPTAPRPGTKLTATGRIVIIDK